VKLRAIVLALLCLGLRAQTPLVEQVRTLGDRRDFAGTDRLVDAARKQKPNTPELALAISWQARTALAAKNYPLAERYADQARSLCLQILKKQKLDSESFLPLALGASMEVQAQVMAARGEVSGAVAFLQDERVKYAKTSIVERISKNINLLSLEGKAAPPLTATEWIGATKPPSLASMKGKPVLLFFWAHWCSDCKAQAPILARLMVRYGPRGLQMIAPTRYYGYVEGGEDAPPAKEKPYIAKIRDQYYAPLKSAPAPLSNATFEAYGCSTTPTLALIDKQGIVRWYHPGNATEIELAQKIEALLK
jgi:thiol-disulfide isomerase/thioredoxin